MTADLVVITDSNLPTTGVEEDVLTAGSLIVRRAQCGSAEEVIAASEGASALIVQWAPITAAVFDAAADLRVVSRLGIGVEMIDVESATAHGVAVMNAPSYCLDEVAVHALALALAGVRGLGRLDRGLRAGEWSVTTVAPNLLRPSAITFAVLGFGRIGSRVAAAASAIGFRVVVCDRYVPDEVIRESGHEPVDLTTTLREADVLTLHLPLTDESRHILDANAFAQLKPGCFLVNTSRGELIDEAALLAALRTRRLGGAALDAFAVEPLPMDSPLLRFPNVHLTPHASWYSLAALYDLWSAAATNVVDFLAGNVTDSIVNPEYAAASVIRADARS